MAKIVVSVLAKDLGSLLSNLALNQEFADNVKYTLELDIVDSKENFETLVKSGKIVDWEFLTTVTEDYSPKKSDFKYNQSLLEEYPSALEIYQYFNHPEFSSDKDNLLKLLFLAWNIKSKSPNRLFTLCSLSSTNHLKSHIIDLKELAENFPRTLNSRLEDYYLDMPFEAVLEDTIYKLSNLWDKLSDIQDFNNVIDEFLKL